MITNEEARKAIEKYQKEHPLPFGTMMDVTAISSKEGADIISETIEKISKKLEENTELWCICEMAKMYMQGVRPVYPVRQQGEWVNFDQESVYDNTFRDHYFYLLAVKGFGTAIKAKFHDDPLPCFTHYAIQNNVVGEYAIDLEDITHWMHLPTIPGQEEES